MIPNYAFIFNTQHFQNPFLVHISQRTRTNLTLVRRYEPNVIYCPHEMDNIVKSILYNRDMFKIRSLVKKELFCLLKQRSRNQFCEGDLCDIVVCSIIKNKLLQKGIGK